RAARDDAESALGNCGGERLRIGHHLLLILLESRLHRFLEADGFRGDGVHQRPTLCARKRKLIQFLRKSRFAKHQPPRGRRSVLCVVVDTISACGPGLGSTPAATSPEMCPISKKKIAPTVFAPLAMR